MTVDADLLAKAAAGLADDLLTTTLLTAHCPVVFAPAMHTEMWEHPATRANVATLRERGVLVVEPAEGRLTGADTGKGRLPEPAEVFALCVDVLDRDGDTGRDLVGRHVVVSAGGTREYLDPVRFLGNRSSGLQGYALARAAAARGAKVTLVAANTSLDDPAGVDVVRVETTEQLREAVLTAAATADAVVMAAAPADFRPTSRMEEVELAEDAEIRRLSAEQSNSSLILGETLVLKLVRRVTAGIHPEAEMTRYLTERGFAGAPTVGQLERTLQEREALSGDRS